MVTYNGIVYRVHGLNSMGSWPLGILESCLVVILYCQTCTSNPSKRYCE